MKAKVIYNPSIARQLLKKGNLIIDIKPNSKKTTETVFVFECTDKLLSDLTSVSK